MLGAVAPTGAGANARISEPCLAVQQPHHARRPRRRPRFGGPGGKRRRTRPPVATSVCETSFTPSVQYCSRAASSSPLRVPTTLLIACLILSGKRGIEFVAVDVDFAGPVQAAGGGDPLAVAADRHTEDAALHGRQTADQVRVVADHAARLTEQAVDLGHAVRTADDDLVALWVPGHGTDPALQSAGRDRRDVVDEPLRGDFGQLGRSCRGRRRPGACRRPRTPCPAPSRRGPPDTAPARRSVASMARTELSRAAEGDQLAVRRPTAAVHRVVGDGGREDQLPLLHVPDLDFAHAARQAAGDRQPLAVRREPDGLDPLGHADQPRDQAGAVGLVQQHLMEPGDRQQLAIGRDSPAT